MADVWIRPGRLELHVTAPAVHQDRKCWVYVPSSSLFPPSVSRATPAAKAGQPLGATRCCTVRAVPPGYRDGHGMAVVHLHTSL